MARAGRPGGTEDDAAIRPSAGWGAAGAGGIGAIRGRGSALDRAGGGSSLGGGAELGGREPIPSGNGVAVAGIEGRFGTGGGAERFKTAPGGGGNEPALTGNDESPLGCGSGGRPECGVGNDETLAVRDGGRGGGVALAGPNRVKSFFFGPERSGIRPHYYPFAVAPHPA